MFASSYGLASKFWKVFMRRGNAAFIYNLIILIFFLFKKIFRILVRYKVLQRYRIYSLSVKSFTFSYKLSSFLALNPSFIFFHLAEVNRPATLLSSRLVRRDLKKIPIFFNIEERAYSKTFRWLKEIVKTKNPSFFLLPQRLLLELIYLYRNTSSVSALKKNLHDELLTTRPNLRFLNKI